MSSLKLKQERPRSKPKFEIKVDVYNKSILRGWSKPNFDSISPVAVNIKSTSNNVTLIANLYRPDIRRVGLHKTGYCGFYLDISSWTDKKVKITPISVIEENKTSKREAPIVPICFLHIPKTAGTSFKKAAEEYFGEDAVVKNYGDKSIETTHWVKKKYLDNKSIDSLYDELHTRGAGMYAGHVNAIPLCNIFPSHKMVAFLRNPVDQVLSHYNHYKRWYDYKQPLEKFIETPGFKNIQSSYLNGIPIYLMGFIGITEQYKESIEVYNHYYNQNIKKVVTNVNDKKNIEKIDSELRKRIQRLNSNDMVLYERGLKLLKDRIKNKQTGFEWCYGAIFGFQDNLIKGAAFRQFSEKPVELNVYYNNQILGSCIAKSYRHGLLKHKLPRDGYIGFEYRLPNGYKRESIRVEVADSGQNLISVV